jgi:hypothetical protein
MAVDMEQVRAALDPDEPDYSRAAKQLGAEALPHLEKIIGGSEISLAAKAAYLAGLIGGEQAAPAVAKAARSSQAPVRIAAAAAAQHLPDESRESVLLQLVDDADHGVQKVAVRSAPLMMSDTLRSRVTAVSQDLQPAAPAKAKAKKAAKTAKKPAKTAKKAKKK